MSNLEGVGVALVTPFKSDLSIDYAGLERLLEHVSQGGVDYLVVMGTTAEAPTLNEKEKLEVLRFIKQNNPRQLPIVYGMGGNNTSALVESLNNMEDEVDAYLSASPYYNKPSQEGIIQHYELLADHAAKPLILYNVPGRTSSNLTAATTLKLAQHPNIIGTKEASGSILQCMEIAAGKPADFMLISGDDMMTVPMISIGAVGVISVIANALPAEFSRMVNAALSQQYTDAQPIVNHMVSVNELTVREGNPTGIKAALEVLGISARHVRLPLVAASSDLRESFASLLSEQLVGNS